jgi:hypothetical protein
MAGNSLEIAGPIPQRFAARANTPSLWSTSPAWRKLSIASGLFTSLAIAAPIVLHPEPVSPRVQFQGTNRPPLSSPVVALSTASAPPSPVAAPLTTMPTPLPPQTVAPPINPPQLAEAPTQTCAANLLDAPGKVLGRVEKTLTQEQALEATRRVEHRTGGHVNPSYLAMPHIIVHTLEPNSEWKTMAAIPPGVSVKVGDHVEVSSRYRDPSRPCDFIPWAVIRVIN